MKLKVVLEHSDEMAGLLCDNVEVRLVCKSILVMKF
jgi:hypothetical protein